MAKPRNVAILMFDEVEVLDFAGPFEVFAVTGRNDQVKPFNVYTVAERAGSVRARNGLSVNPTYTLADCPASDVVVIPGGWGTRGLLENAIVLDWIRDVSSRAEIVFSVCTGALLLGKLGLLNGHSSTTHHSQLDTLAMLSPATKVVRDRRFVDSGRIVTAAGIAAGIDASLHLVARLLGDDVAKETSAYMEYPWRPTEG